MALFVEVDTGRRRAVDGLEIEFEVIVPNDLVNQTLVQLNETLNGGGLEDSLNNLGGIWTGIQVTPVGSVSSQASDVC